MKILQDPFLQRLALTTAIYAALVAAWSRG